MSGNPMRKRGTQHESWLVRQLLAAGLWARRLAEGGSADEGDVETVIAGRRWVLEAKFRATLNVQDTLGKAREKAVRAAGGHAVPVAVVWKRLVKTDGYKVRQPVRGERVIVAVSLDDFLELVVLAELGAAVREPERLPDSA